MWLLVVAACVPMTTSQAFAGDWSLKFLSSSTAIADDNVNLGKTDRDSALVVSQTINVDLLADARTYEIEFSPILNLQKTSFSEGGDEVDFFPSASLSLRKSLKNTSFTIDTYVARSEASANELVDDVVHQNKGDRLDSSVIGNVTHKLDDRDSLVWTSSVRLVDFTLQSTELVPFTSVGSSIGWRRQLTELVDTGFSVGAENFNPDSATEGETLVYRSTASVNARMTKRLSAMGSLGASLLADEGDKTKVNFNFALGADYKIRDTNYSLNAAYDVLPTQGGNFENTLSTRAIVNHQVNDLTSLSILAAYSLQTGSSSQDSSALTLTPSLYYQLSQEWKSSLSYRFIHSDDGGERAYSNALMVNLSYGRDLLP